MPVQAGHHPAPCRRLKLDRIRLQTQEEPQVQMHKCSDVELLRSGELAITEH
ncbi:hypothetical protein ACFTAO_11165 [Paenibacillus rhizoplanae]|uniref:Uncharacterized protein n=1 Tax=Paenibacillus rhizoplanae TaxID=1917181 RepID=A0ABW5F488_9BACL